MRLTRASIFPVAPILICVCGLLASPSSMTRAAGLTFEQLAGLRSVEEVRMAPGGDRVAYTLVVPRVPGTDEDGPAWRELHVLSLTDGSDRPFVAAPADIDTIRFTPDGKSITYLAKRDDDEHDSLWAIPVDGGESRKLLDFEEKILDYRVAPDGARVAFVALEPESKTREKARDKGYAQEVFEEDWRPRQLWIAPLPADPPAIRDPSQVEDDAAKKAREPKPLPLEGSTFNLEWSPDGRALALTLAPRPLIDDRYMMRRIHVVDASSGEQRSRLDNPGKLGPFAFSPDGRNIALISAEDPNDPRDGRLLVAPTSGGPLVDLLPGLQGHVSALAWQDASTVMFVADEGAETRLAEVDLRTRQQKTHLVSGSRLDDGSTAPLLRTLSLSADGKHAAFAAESPRHPREVFSMTHGAQATRRTVSNPWLGDVDLAPQEVWGWTARDGVELEGVLIRPLQPLHGSPAPLLLMVHGGPEGHDRNGWPTNYSRPGQLAAARGYAVFYPNYRGSTGRGVAFSKLGQGDAAGKEFDDLIDAVDALAAAGIADRERVGINGGSYGGYATAWCSTRHTERFRAGVMFVGISNKISKGLTTEIPVEDEMVHTRFDPWTRWQFSLERSPIYHAERSRTALLIAGGTADKRVHPSQSLQLYRALKLIGKTPVRYVRYPGEEHGNRKAAARDDYARRLIRWMDHFVVGGSGELPPWDLGLGQDSQDAGD